VSSIGKGIPPVKAPKQCFLGKNAHARKRRRITRALSRGGRVKYRQGNRLLGKNAHARKRRRIERLECNGAEEKGSEAVCNPYERGTAGPPFRGVLPSHRVLIFARVAFLFCDDTAPGSHSPPPGPSGVRDGSPRRGMRCPSNPRGTGAGTRL